MSARVSAALPGVTPDATVAWPASGAVSSATLKTLVATGHRHRRTQLHRRRPRRRRRAAVASGLARLESNGSDVAAALVSPTVEKYVTQAIGPNGAASLPSLVAELAVRAAQEPDAEHAVVLDGTALRQPVRRVRHAGHSTTPAGRRSPSRCRCAISSEANLLPTGRSRLARVPASAAALPQSTVEATSRVADALPDITSLLTPQTANGTLAHPGRGRSGAARRPAGRQPAGGVLGLAATRPGDRGRGSGERAHADRAHRLDRERSADRPAVLRVVHARVQLVDAADHRRQQAALSGQRAHQHHDRRQRAARLQHQGHRSEVHRQQSETHAPRPDEDRALRAHQGARGAADSRTTSRWANRYPSPCAAPRSGRSG